ncbi:MAG: hypothetical protein AAB290_02980 [Candidatus Eisenbacteria bacterium]
MSLAAAPAGAQPASPRPAAADTAAGIGVAGGDTAAAPGTEGAESGAGVRSVPSGIAARAPRTLPERARLDQPRWVMLRSLLVPGWGQAHNHAWIKAALLAAGDGSLRWRLVRDERRLNDLSGQAVGRRADLAVAEVQVAAAQAELTAAQASGDSVRIAAAEAALLAANLGRIGASEAFNDVVGAFNTLLDASTNRRWLAGGVVIYALLDAYVDAHFRTFDVDFRFDPALPGGGKTPGVRLQLRWRF